MMNTNAVRVAAIAVAIACATAAGAQQTDTPTFVPEARLVAATEPGAPPEAVAKMVFDDPQATAEEPIEPVRLAQAQPAVTIAQPVRLPDTAGWAPLLGLFGVLALFGGILWTTGRRGRGREVPGDTDIDESRSRGRGRSLAKELEELWARPTTTESLRPRDEVPPRSEKTGASQNAAAGLRRP